MTDESTQAETTAAPETQTVVVAALNAAPHALLSHLEAAIADAERLPAEFLARLRDLVTLVKSKL